MNKSTKGVGKVKDITTATEVMMEMQASDRLGEIKWLAARLNMLINPPILPPQKKQKRIITNEKEH